MQRARQHIVAGGEVSSVWVAITETTGRVGPAGYPEAVVRRWRIANTSRVLDLAGPQARLRAGIPSD